MIEKIRSNLFRIKIPLPGNSLKFLNAYVVRSPEKSLLIDTGMDQEECLGAMHDGLLEIGVALDKTDIFITHLHADHFSLVSRLVTDNTQVFFNRPDAQYVASWAGIDSIIRYASGHGFPEDMLRIALKAHPASRFGSWEVPKLNILSEGQKLTYGDYVFTCIETPGHTFGHTCLYEPNKKIFVSGDHLLGDITPNIQCWSDQGNPLKSYLESLKKVYALDVDLVLPGHRRLFYNHRRRIDELIAHHHERLYEMMGILAGGAMSAFETASKMIWNIRADTWEGFPMVEKLFATGEAISHLKYLEEKGVIKRTTEEGMHRYTIRRRHGQEN